MSLVCGHSPIYGQQSGRLPVMAFLRAEIYVQTNPLQSRLASKLLKWKLMFKKILFPVDFSASCAAMATYVKRVADLFGSQVTLIHIVDLQSHNGFELYLRTLQEIAAEHWGIAHRRLNSFLESEFPQATCPRVLRSGEAAAYIAAFAREGKFDLIILPTHAARFRQMILGSTTAKVLNDADCPVITTAHAETPPRTVEHRNMICAIGLTDDSERVLRFACRTTLQLGANLLVVHAVHGNHNALPQLSDKEQLDSYKESEASSRLYELEETAGCSAPVHIAVGKVKEVLVEAAQEFAADGIIIGRQPRSGVLGRMRDLTYSVIRDSPCPVLSV